MKKKTINDLIEILKKDLEETDTEIEKEHSRIYPSVKHQVELKVKKETLEKVLTDIKKLELDKEVNNNNAKKEQ